MKFTATTKQLQSKFHHPNVIAFVLLKCTCVRYIDEFLKPLFTPLHFTYIINQMFHCFARNSTKLRVEVEGKTFDVLIIKLSVVIMFRQSRLMVGSNRISGTRASEISSSTKILFIEWFHIQSHTCLI